MAIFRAAGSKKNPAFSVALSLIASLLVLVGPFSDKSDAYTDFTDPGTITYNDKICNLGDPANHQSSATAFEISTSDQLWEVTDCVSTSATIYFKLADNINVSEAVAAPTASPIGYDFTHDEIGYSFSGVLDGQNKVVSGIAMSSTFYGVGLFALLEDATISNLVIEGSFVTSSRNGDPDESAGSLAIMSRGYLSLTSISNRAQVSGVVNVGGLLGFAFGGVTISGSSNTGDVSGLSLRDDDKSVGQAGGLVGISSDSTAIYFSHNHGLVSGGGAVGGLVGQAFDLTVVSSTNHNSVSGTLDSVGGLAGDVHGERGAVIISSSNTGLVSGPAAVGGLVGSARAPSMIRFSHNLNELRGASKVGGLVGEAGGLTVISSTNQSTVSANSGIAGGLVGNVYGASLVIASSGNFGSVSGRGNLGTGGLAGRSELDLTIDSSSNNAAVSSQGQRVGGLAGSATANLNVNMSRNTGRVTGAQSHVAGLVGFVGIEATITSSQNSGPTSGEGSVGGLLGETFNATINSSENSGLVSSGRHNNGGLIGRARGDVSINSSQNTGAISGSIPAFSRDTGGLIGLAESSASINSSQNSGAVSGRERAGGLIARAEGDASINASQNTGVVYSQNGLVGGLIGRAAQNASVNSSQNTGAVSSPNSTVGGLIGGTSWRATITASHNSATISGNATVGGLLGTATSFEILGSHNTGRVSGAIHVGGLVGQVSDPSRVAFSFNGGAVSGSPSSTHIGGLVGRSFGNGLAEPSLMVVSSYNTHGVSGGTNVGGLLGSADAVASFMFSSNSGAVSGSDMVGGLVGSAFSVYITSSQNLGTVSGVLDVGGLIGSVGDLNGDPLGLLTVSLSFNDAAVFGQSWVGGLVGRSHSGASIINTYNTGALSGSSQVGGLAGHASGSAVIQTSYNTGAVAGETDVDGLVGTLSAIATFSALYSAEATSHGAVKARSDMKVASTFVGFDFASIWGFGRVSDNQGFPMLRVFAQLTEYFGDFPRAFITPNSSVASAQAANYMGPMITIPRSARVGTEVVFTGTRLESATRVFAGGIELSVSALVSESKTLKLPTALRPGTYDLIVLSGFGTLTVISGLTVLDPTVPAPEPEAPKKVLSVGTFKGYIAIYTKGYEGSKLSAKVAGKWLVVPVLKESWKSKDYSRAVRFTGAGYSIQVRLFIDKAFQRTLTILTR